MKKSRVVYLLLTLCLVLAMFVGCTANKEASQAEGAGNDSNSLAVDEGDFDDPFAE